MVFFSQEVKFVFIQIRDHQFTARLQDSDHFFYCFWRGFNVVEIHVGKSIVNCSIGNGQVLGLSNAIVNCLNVRKFSLHFFQDCFRLINRNDLKPRLYQTFGDKACACANISGDFAFLDGSGRKCCHSDFIGEEIFAHFVPVLGNAIKIVFTAHWCLFLSAFGFLSLLLIPQRVNWIGDGCAPGLSAYGDEYNSQRQ